MLSDKDILNKTKIYNNFLLFTVSYIKHRIQVIESFFNVLKK